MYRVLLYYVKKVLLMCHCLLDQSVVNHAISELSRCLSACVDAEGGHFEHYLRLLLSE